LGDQDDTPVSDDPARGLLPVSPLMVVEEIDSIIRLLQRHRVRFEQMQSGAVPEARLAPVVVEAVGEFLFASAKLESLGRIINGEGNG
jgi:hypothetical protein